MYFIDVKNTHECYMFFENVRNPHTFVRYWYEIRDIMVPILHLPILHDVKFTKCEIYGSTVLKRYVEMTLFEG